MAGVHPQRAVPARTAARARGVRRSIATLAGARVSTRRSSTRSPRSAEPTAGRGRAQPGGQMDARPPPTARRHPRQPRSPRRAWAGVALPARRAAADQRELGDRPPRRCSMRRSSSIAASLEPALDARDAATIEVWAPARRRSSRRRSIAGFPAADHARRRTAGCARRRCARVGGRQRARARRQRSPANDRSRSPSRPPVASRCPAPRAIASLELDARRRISPRTPRPIAGCARPSCPPPGAIAGSADGSRTARPAMLRARIARLLARARRARRSSRGSIASPISARAPRSRRDGRRRAARAASPRARRRARLAGSPASELGAARAVEPTPSATQLAGPQVASARSPRSPRIPAYRRAVRRRRVRVSRPRPARAAFPPAVRDQRALHVRLGRPRARSPSRHARARLRPAGRPRGPRLRLDSPPPGGGRRRDLDRRRPR